MSCDVIRKMILAECPDYDFNRYRFKSGDVVKLDDNAVIIVKESCLTYVTAYVHKRSFKYHMYGEVRIPYTELPYFAKGKFQPYTYSIQKKLQWKVGDIVEDPTYDMIGYLLSEQGHQRFYMYVLETDYPYYLHTGVYIENPYAEYVQAVN